MWWLYGSAVPPWVFKADFAMARILVLSRSGFVHQVPHSMGPGQALPVLGEAIAVRLAKHHGPLSPTLAAAGCAYPPSTFTRQRLETLGSLVGGELPETGGADVAPVRLGPEAQVAKPVATIHPAPGHELGLGVDHQRQRKRMVDKD